MWILRRAFSRKGWAHHSKLSPLPSQIYGNLDDGNIISYQYSMMGRIYQLITSVYAVTRWESLININECVSLMYILEMSIFLCKCIYPYYLLLMSMVVPNRYCTVVSPDGMGNQLRGQHISYEGNLSFPTAT